MIQNKIPKFPNIDVEALDFVLESVKTLEKENEALKSKLKYEEDKFVNETAEKVSMKRQVASSTEGDSKAKEDGSSILLGMKDCDLES